MSVFYQYQLTYPHLCASRARDEHYEPSEFERHCHTDHELIYITKGHGAYLVEGAEYPLRPHMLLLVRPYEYHSACPDPSLPYERVVIHFDADAYLPPAIASQPVLREHQGTCFLMKSADHPIRAAFEALDNIVPLSHGGKDPTPRAEALLCATLTQILVLLTLEAPLAPIRSVSDPVRRAIEYLNLHLTEELSLDALAKEIFISKYHLSRLFHAQTGASIFRYFNTKRMALARRMLEAGESATAVASRLGFRDYSTFYRAYRRESGEAPVRGLEKTTN